MPRVLIVGCGYVGEATADLFHARDWEVEGWTASAESAAALATKPYRVIACNASELAAVSADDGTIDAVIQCVSSGGGDADAYRRVYLRSAENLVRAFPEATLLFTSSTSVYAQREAQWVDERSPAEPERETAKVLRETENVVLANGGIVARLAGIYGPARSALLKKFLNGEAISGAGTERFVNYIHRDDVAAALYLLISRRAELKVDRIYNIVDDVPLTAQAASAWLAQTLNRPLSYSTAAPSPRKRGDSNKRVSNAKLRALGWQPKYPTFQKGMECSVIPSWDV